jgi:CreA protein
MFWGRSAVVTSSIGCCFFCASTVFTVAAFTPNVYHPVYSSRLSTKSHQLHQDGDSNIQWSRLSHHSQRDTIDKGQATQEPNKGKLSSVVGIMFGLLAMVAPLHTPLDSLSSTYFANAAESKVVGSFSGSGLIFKDTLQIEVVDDPKVQGIRLYVSNFILPITEKLSSTKNLFSDPSSASLTCAKTGPIKIADTIAKGPAGEQVFQESKSLLFKSLKVQRIYDEDNQTLIYVSYNTRLDKNDDSNKSRFKSSLCAIGIE